MIVNGNEAFITGSLTEPESAVGYLTVVHVVDNGDGKVVLDEIRFSFNFVSGYIYESAVPGCYLPVLAPVPVTAGNIVVKDA